MRSSGKILVSTMDTLPQHCSLQHLKRFHLLFLGPSTQEDTNKHLLSPPEIRGLNAPVANWIAYSFKSTINSNIGVDHCMKKVVKSTALWMFRVAPLDNHLLSTYELLMSSS